MRSAAGCTTADMVFLSTKVRDGETDHELAAAHGRLIPPPVLSGAPTVHYA